MSTEGKTFAYLGEETVYSSWLTLAKARFRAPDGGEFEREVIHHPGAVSVVPLLDDGDTLLLVHQYRAALQRNILEIPAGKRDVKDEPPEQTARRELAEEIGMSAGRLDLLCSFYNSPGFSDELQFVFLARDLVAVESSSTSIEEEHMTVERVRLRELPQLIASSTIVDAKTIIGLLLTRDWLGMHLGMR